jgi:hypothetical protein
MRRGGVRVWMSAAVIAAVAGPVSAQLPNPSAAALGMGGNFTALARGFDALAWNPAGLAAPSAPSYSVAVLSTGGDFGLSPVSLFDLVRYGDSQLSDQARERWLNAIDAAGGEKGQGGADITYLALSTSGFGFQVATSLQAVIDAPPDLAALALSSGPRGGPGSVTSFSNGAVDFAATSSVGLSYAQRVPMQVGSSGRGQLMVGVTLKYTVGHFLLTGRPEPIVSEGPDSGQVGFPVLQTDTGQSRGINGSGLGIDIGALLQLNQLSVGLTIKNALNGFDWKANNMVERPVGAVFGATTGPGAASQPFESAPADLQARVLDLKYKPEVLLGAAYQVSERLVLSGDIQSRPGGGMELNAASHVGVGAEYRLVPNVPVRLGVAAVGGKVQVAGGAGVEVAGVSISLAGALQDTDLGTTKRALVTFSYVGSR